MNKRGLLVNVSNQFQPDLCWICIPISIRVSQWIQLITPAWLGSFPVRSYPMVVPGHSSQCGECVPVIAGQYHSMWWRRQSERNTIYTLTWSTVCCSLMQCTVGGTGTSGPNNSVHLLVAIENWHSIKQIWQGDIDLDSFVFHWNLRYILNSHIPL